MLTSSILTTKKNLQRFHAYMRMTCGKFEYTYLQKYQNRNWKTLEQLHESSFLCRKIDFDHKIKEFKN